jgi:hypothetical protein
LNHRARQGDAAYGHEVAERKMQAHAEHQQHHANFGELAG